MKKYEFTGETKEWCNRTLRRIRALISFGNVEAGDLGGWIEKEENLDNSGNAWVSGDARVCGNAWVYGNAWVCGNAEVSGDVRVSGDAWVYGAYAIMTVSNVGSRNDTTTFFTRKDRQIGVRCGCFNGTIDEFAAAVQKTHGDNEHGKLYMLAIEMAKLRIKLPEEEMEEA